MFSLLHLPVRAHMCLCGYCFPQLLVESNFLTVQEASSARLVIFGAMVKGIFSLIIAGIIEFSIFTTVWCAKN